MKKNLSTNLQSAKKPYQIQVEGITVNLEYMKNNTTFEECMLNILKSKAINLSITDWIVGNSHYFFSLQNKTKYGKILKIKT